MSKLIERAAAVAAIGVKQLVDSAGIEPDLRQPTVFYLLVTGANLPGATVAGVFGCTKQNISKRLRRLEDAREDPAFDRKLDELADRLFGAAMLDELRGNGRANRSAV